MTPEHLLEFGWLLITAMIAAVVWFVRLEGRVNLIERVTSDWIKERREVMTQVVTHMERIEAKVDRINLRCAAVAHLHQYREERNGETA